MITSTKTTSPEDFTLTACPVSKLLTRKKFVKYGNSYKQATSKSIIAPRANIYRHLIVWRLSY